MSDGTDYEYRGLMAEAWDVLRGDTMFTVLGKR